MKELTMQEEGVGGKSKSKIALEEATSNELALKKLSFKQKIQLVIIMLGSSMAVMAGAAVAPSLPAMRQHFSNEPNIEFYVKLMLTLPGLSIAIASFFVGIALDAFGRKRIILVFMVVYAIAGAGGLYLNSISALLVSRAVLGLAVSVLMSGFLTLLGDYYQGPKLEKLMGIYAGSLGLSAVVFLLLGGFLADIGWRMPFMLYLLILLLILPYIFFIDEPVVKKKPGRVSFISQQLRSAPWLVLSAVFLFSSFARVAFYNVPVQLPFFFLQLGIYSGKQVGVGIAFLAFVSSLTAVNYRIVRKYFSYTAIYTFSLLILGMGYYILSNAVNFYVALVGLGIAGMGLGFFVPNTNIIVLDVTNKAIRGRVVGLLTATTFGAQFVSPILTQPIIAVSSYAFSFRFFGYLAWMLVLPTVVVMVYNYRKRTKDLQMT